MRAIVHRLYPGATIVVVASGPSLCQADVVDTVSFPTIAVNDAYRLMPFASMLFGGDLRWWIWNPAAQLMRCPKYSLHASVTPPIQRLERTGQDGLEVEPTGLRSGGHSGYAAMNLAYHLVGDTGTLVLLGYDMQKPVEGPAHFFGDHPDQSAPRFDQWIPKYLDLYEALTARGVTVWNCSRETAIPSIPRKPLREALPCSTFR